MSLCLSLVQIPIDAPAASVKYLDAAPVTGISYGEENYVQRDGQYYINNYSNNPIDPNTLNTGGDNFYVVHIVGENGRTAYAGPIWVEVTP